VGLAFLFHCLFNGGLIDFWVGPLESFKKIMRLALYQPDIPQNTGTIIRLCACLGIPLDIIEPCGFAFSSRELKRAALDYGPLADVQRHRSWQTFRSAHSTNARIVLLTTKAPTLIYDFAFQQNDTLMMGSEQSGVPEDVHKAVNSRVTIPILPAARSLNIAIAAGIAVSEAGRQLAERAKADAVA
jgi:tRNA (cytidine/uridine-2'-O-)-methyltransferase